MKWWNDRPTRAGYLAVAALIWVPTCLIGGLLVGGKDAAWAGTALAFAPFGLGLIWLWAILVALIRSTEAAIAALAIGVPALLYVFGPAAGAILIALSGAWWIASKPLLQRLHARRVTRHPSRLGPYTAAQPPRRSDHRQYP